MKKSPFELKIGKPLDMEWQEGDFLNYDQSSTDPRFEHKIFDQERKPFKNAYLIAILGAIFAVLAFRLVYLQILHYNDYLRLAEGNRIREQKIFAPRGMIYDSKNKVLARNEPSFELVLTPLDLPKDDNSLQTEVMAVAKIFGLDEKYLDQQILDSDRNSFFPLTLKQDVNKEQAVIFATQQDSFSGFTVDNKPLRFYENKLATSHILGYTGKLTKGEYEKLQTDGYAFDDIIGRDGLEQAYEKYLRGVFGERLIEVDAHGIVKNTYQQKNSLPGNDLHLYLDLDLQKVIFDALTKQTKGKKYNRAAAVAVDPNTGGVLAMVSLPSYDDNLFAQGISDEEYKKIASDENHPLINRAISGTYPPGSTVKPFLGAAALQEGVVKETTKIYDGGQIVVPNPFNPQGAHIFRGWKPSGLGNMDVYDAIAMSSDIYFYTVGGGQQDLGIDGLGAERVAKYLKEFFLGQSLGIDLPNEKSGLIPTPEWKQQRFAGSQVEEKWYLGDTYNMSIGQGFVLVTPLQLVVATAAIANGGTVYKPLMVKDIVDRNGKVVQSNAPTVLNSSFLDLKYIQASKTGMRRAVTSGTARVLNDLSIQIAGKTGTSQFDDSNPSKTHAWFTSFAPYESPKIALTVLIEAGGEGTSAAVPVAREIYDWYSKNRM